MTTVVHVQVDGLDLDDESLDPVLEGFDNATFSEVDGLKLMTVFVEDGEDVTAVVIEACHKLTNKVPGSRAKRVHPDLVSAADIAHRVGVSREATRKWVNDPRLGFPVHLDTVGKDQRIWRWVEVVDWLYKVKGIDMDEDLPTVDQIAHIDSCLHRVPDVTSQAWAKVQEPVSTRTTLLVRHLDVNWTRAKVSYEWRARGRALDHVG